MYIMTCKKTSAAARVLSTLAAASVLGGCAMKGDVRDLQLEIRSLAARQDSLLAELRQEALSTQDTLRTQSDQMFDFRGDINRSIRQVAASLARLEALAGENQRGIAQVRDQLANTRRGSAPGVGPLVSDPTMPPPTQEQLVGGGAGNPDQLWSVAMQQYDRQSLNAATMAFRQFLDEHPSDARAARAHFFLADILEQQERPEDALEEFQRLPALYPTDAEVPNAMYRIARLQLGLGRPDEARATLERIMNTYPDAPIAMLAREMLDEIG